MNISDVILHSRNMASFSTLLPLSSVQTEEQKEKANLEGYQVGYTYAEFTSKFPSVNPNHIYFCLGFDPVCYWDSEKLTIFIIHLHRTHFMSPTDSTLEEYVASGIRTITALSAKNQYDIIANTLSDRMRIEYLAILAKRQITDLYEVFLNIYPHADYGSDAIDLEVMNLIIKSKTDQQKARTEQALQAYPEVLTVYRGYGSKSTPLDKAFSWSLKSKVANFFASRLSSDVAGFYEAKVKKSDIIEYLDMSNEAECIILPDALFDIKNREFYGASWLSNIDSDFIDEYTNYRNTANYQKIRFLIKSDIHGRGHAERVLFHSLLLAKEYHLSLKDKRVLAEASLYHDVGRKNDRVDDSHGRRSAEIYAKARKSYDPAITFLMKYHCLPDEDGYECIRTTPELAAQSERVTTLFRIFKDADGLDRVRLGHDQLDVTLLRTDIAQKLPIIATLTYKQLNVRS